MVASRPLCLQPLPEPPVQVPLGSLHTSSRSAPGHPLPGGLSGPPIAFAEKVPTWATHWYLEGLLTLHYHPQAGMPAT